LLLINQTDIFYNNIDINYKYEFTAIRIHPGS